MGKGFAARRGGPVKTGLVSNVTATAISDPALVGMKNGLILLATSIGAQGYYGGTSGPVLVAQIAVKDGVIDLENTFVLQSRGSSPAGYMSRLSGASVAWDGYDPATGTISNLPNDTSFSGRAPLDGYQLAEYRYYIWD